MKAKILLISLTVLFTSIACGEAKKPEDSKKTDVTKSANAKAEPAKTEAKPANEEGEPDEKTKQPSAENKEKVEAEGGW